MTLLQAALDFGDAIFGVTQAIVKSGKQRQAPAFPQFMRSRPLMKLRQKRGLDSLHVGTKLLGDFRQFRVSVALKALGVASKERFQFRSCYRRVHNPDCSSFSLR